MNRVLTVTTPAASQDLISLAELKTLLGISGNDEDAALALKITAASSQISTFCNRVFIAETVTEEVWTDPWAKDVVLSRWPVANGITVSENGVALTSDEFRCSQKTGVLHRKSSNALMNWGETYLSASYVGGYANLAAVPADLKDAAKRMVALMRSKDARDPLVKSEEIPGVMITGYWVGPVGTDALPPDVMGLLKPYRRMNAL